MDPATTKQNSYKAKRLVAQKDIMLLGFVASLFSISVGISLIFEEKTIFSPLRISKYGCS